MIQTIDVSALETQNTMPQRPHWWDQFQLYRRTDLLRLSKQNDRRELWRTQKDFFLTCLGFMVGVGHTMRFPAKVYQHGGGVFFIPYFFSLIFFGLPLVFLHLSLGQYTGQAANTAFQKLMPIGSGLWANWLILSFSEKIISRSRLGPSSHCHSCSCLLQYHCCLGNPLFLPICKRTSTWWKFALGNL